MPYGEGVMVSSTTIRILVFAACTVLLSSGTWAQVAAKPASSAGHSTLIGCLAGPDADDHYTLTSMQHRLGVEVEGGDELKDQLKKGAGAKVKLTGSWGTLPGSEGKTGDAARRFNATGVTVMEEKCQAPTGVTPVSKKKQQAQKK